MAKSQGLVTAAILTGLFLPQPSSASADLGVYAKPQRMVSLPDGRRLNLFCTGSGSPTVILEAGWSDSTVAWRAVQPRVARWTRVCSYDRAGLGFSDPPNGARDTASIVADLDALLRAAEISGPYVLVGYSLGGMSMRLFADRRLGDVAGVVLVEPSTEYQAQRFITVEPGLPRLPPPLRGCEGAAHLTQATCTPAAPGLPEQVKAAHARLAATESYQATILAELVGMSGEGSAQVTASRRSYGSMPLIVLTAEDNLGEPGYSAAQIAAFRRTWTAMHAEVASLSSRGEHRQVADATHLVVIEQPQVVADAIREVAAAASAP